MATISDTLGILQTLSRSDGFAFTQHALELGAGASSVAGQHAQAIANLLAWLQQNGYITAPVAPVPTTSAVVTTLLAGTYGAIVSYVSSSGGESVASPAGSVVVPGPNTNNLVVPSPSAATNASGWYAYVTQPNGATYTRQQAAGSPTAIGTNLTITAPPTSTGTNPLTADTSAGVQFAQVAKDALAHLTARLNWMNNPAGTVYLGDRN